MKNFLTELRRRNVIRVAGLYGVVGWLLAQAAGVLENALTMPAWFDTVVVSLLLLGYPVALILAWAFEMTPEGVRLTRNVDGEESTAPKGGRKLDYAIVASLALVVAIAVSDRLAPARTIADAADGEAANESVVSATVAAPDLRAENASAPAAARSVAVLPFVALSAGADDGYFADGLTEEIINSLTTLPDLLVTARTSAFYFKGKDTPIPEIAKTLGVAHVVEGSVRRAGDRIRITAQLIRAEDGFHLWSENYDRTLDDVFAAQTDIAENIARALGVLLDEQKRALMADAGVKDVDAFMAYQRGLALFDAAHNDAPQVPTLRRANAEFERAIERQPDFAQAHFMHSDFYSHLLMDELTGPAAGETAADGLTADEAIRRLRQDLDAAAQYETDPGQRLVIRAVRTFLSSDWRGLGAEMDKAFAGWENCRNGGWMAPMGAPLGRAEDSLRRGLERTRCDPLRDIYWFDAAYSAIALGRPEEALALADEAEKLGLGDYLKSARVDALLALGRNEDAARALSKSANVEPEQLVKVPAAAGHIAEAKAALAAFKADGDIHREMIARAVAGDRAGANRIATLIDGNPLGAALLTRATYFCMCGAPFDLSATPNYARQLKEGDLSWPPKSPIDWPLKDW